jgi:hypothetical protein
VCSAIAIRTHLAELCQRRPAPSLEEAVSLFEAPIVVDDVVGL